MSRPEYIAPPEVFYGADEAGKYGGNSRMIKIQTAMTERALELARVEPNSGKCVLDIMFLKIIIKLHQDLLNNLVNR